MKIRYKNFEIEQDRSCWVLTEYWIIQKGKNEWKEWIIDQIYPSTLEKTLESMKDRLVRKKQSTTELKGFIEEIKQINKEFIEDIKTLIK